MLAAHSLHSFIHSSYLVTPTFVTFISFSTSRKSGSFTHSVPVITGTPFLQSPHLLSQRTLEKSNIGQQKLLTIGFSIANDAELSLLDEPIASIDKDNYTRLIYNLLLVVKKGGKTILQIEHNMDFVQYLADKHLSIVIIGIDFQ